MNAMGMLLYHQLPFEIPIAYLAFISRHTITLHLQIYVNTSLLIFGYDQNILNIVDYDDTSCNVLWLEERSVVMYMLLHYLGGQVSLLS